MGNRKKTTTKNTNNDPQSPAQKSKFEQNKKDVYFLLILFTAF
jgi:hypothetical protein